MKKEIPIYEASTNQILSIKHSFLNSNYKDFDDLINTFSFRNIYNKDGSINYLNYNDFIYDYTSIEKELAKIILTGKCLFEKDNLKTVIYFGEGFNSLEKFYNKYKHKELEDKEKLMILRYIKRHEYDNKQIKELFTKLQKLIFYLGNNNFKESDTIYNIIKDEYISREIDFILSDFFQSLEISLKGEKIMSIFFFFEHLYFNELIKNIKDEYKEDINDEIKKEISNKLLVKDFNNILSIKELGAAIRRFISRYLIFNNLIYRDNPLIPLLNRHELWGVEIAKLNNLEELIYQLLKEYHLKVGQSYKLYELIKEEDEKEINYKEEEEEEEDEEEIKIRYVRKEKRNIKI